MSELEQMKEEFWRKWYTLDADKYKELFMADLDKIIEQAKKEPTDIITNAATLPNDIKQKLLIIRDALIRKDIDGAYHALYSIADPGFAKHDPWECLQLPGVSKICPFCGCDLDALIESEGSDEGD